MLRVRRIQDTKCLPHLVVGPPPGELSTVRLTIQMCSGGGHPTPLSQTTATATLLIKLPYDAMLFWDLFGVNIGARTECIISCATCVSGSGGGVCTVLLQMYKQPAIEPPRLLFLVAKRKHSSKSLKRRESARPQNGIRRTSRYSVVPKQFSALSPNNKPWNKAHLTHP